MAASKTRPATDRKAEPALGPRGPHAPSADAPTPQGKSIFLFADGTGNSSAKLFKTNVWRMYEAIDFGLASAGKFVQVGYYDNGVGTSNFRPLALLGGIFGIGLKSNVLRLYSFLCRNYQPGDRIYAFGFSRGAFTIRLLVGLVATQGVLRTRNDAPLSYQVRDAYREFRRGFQPNLLPGRIVVALGRAIRDFFLAIMRRKGQLRYCETERAHPDIEFVGVWDTVAAYGGPFAEFTRGIDDWVFPLTMPEYGLSPKVKKARHALSLDDERDAFWPLLWDEIREDELIAKGDTVVIGQKADGTDQTEVRKVGKNRLKQVWFAGVHADVGGGYPDESLSYMPLLWMMDELEPHVDFLQTFVQRARDLANPYGPIHDSRAGVAAYYRYQPRKIAAFTDPPSVSTRSLRPPETDKDLGSHGLLRSVCVHESAIARIISGIDNYAPAALPAQFDIVRAAGPNAMPVLTAADDTTLMAAAPNTGFRYDQQENAWDLVWIRRVLYFATVGLTVVLALLPWLPILSPVEQLCSDDRCFARSIVDTGLFFVPQSFRQMLDPWVQEPVLVIVFSVIILVMISMGQRRERRFRDRVRNIWRDYLGEGLKSFDGRSRLRKIRESAPYQTTYYVLKWGLLPTACGILTLLAIVYAALVLTTQILYAGAEPRGAFCKSPRQPGVAETVTDVRFDTSASCTDLGVDLTKGHPYRLTLKVPAPSAGAKSPWMDGSLPADPRRGVTRRHAYMTLVAPLKRVTSANWMQVVTEVRAKQPDTWARRWLRPILAMPIDIRKHELEFKGGGAYETFFCARWDGRLYVMTNDAAPLLSQRFYNNNVGTAQVSVAPAPDKQCTKPG
jgi:uncharacterized protein (DUF2235 family)